MTTLDWPRPTELPARAWRFPPVAANVLDNGLTVQTCQLTGRRLVSVRLVVPMGAGSEAAGKYGLSTVTAQTMLGGAGGSDAIAFATALERLGASVDITVDWDAALIQLDVPLRGLAPALAVLSDLVVRPDLARGEVDRVRSKQLDLLRQERTDAVHRAAALFAAAVFDSAHREAAPLSGRDDDVAGLTAEDVVAHHAGSVRPDGATLVVAGDSGGLDLAQLVSDVFGGWSGPVKPWPSVPASSPGTHGARVHLVDRPGSVQSAVVVGRSTPGRPATGHADRLLAITGVAGTFNGRVNHRLREQKGYTYGAQGSLQTRRSGGVFVLPFTCRTDATGDALADLVDVLADAVMSGVTAQELRHARSGVLERGPLQLEGSDAVASTLAALAAQGLAPSAYDELRSEVREAREDDVDAAARTYLDPAMLTFAVVGDAEKIRPAVEASGAGEVIA